MPFVNVYLYFVLLQFNFYCMMLRRACLSVCPSVMLGYLFTQVWILWK